MRDSEGQPRNARSPILTTPSPTATSDRSPQSSNAQLPMDATESGTVTDLRLQCTNAYPPIDSTPSGTV